MNTIFPPALLLGLLLCICYAALFHLWGGHGLRDLLLYLFAAMLGFLAGHWLAEILQIPLPQIGELHVVAASLGAWLGLLIVYLFQQGTDTVAD
jgi:hypothetical protein